MTRTRRYKLLCPIARGLDRVGDRWTLLILRDLHAGPARFSDLQQGLKGIASNLLTDRMQQLIDDGLVRKRDGQHGVTLYELTEAGQQTRALLFELAMFGGRFKPDEIVRKPGNLRTIAVTLSTACQRVVTPDMDFEAELMIDDEAFTLIARDSSVDIAYAPATSPDLVMTTSYEPMIAASEGEMDMEEFLNKHTQTEIHTPGKAIEFMALLGAAMAQFSHEV